MNGFIVVKRGSFFYKDLWRRDDFANGNLCIIRAAHANGNDVCFVMVAGETLIRDYQLVRGGEKEILEAGQAIAEEIYEKYSAGK